ncbi:MAG: alpha/beta fold hydrolase [Bacteroidetes bacterium]|nr:alpha/beta fold hydrolase [Bacteroidota bacterium]
MPRRRPLSPLERLADALPKRWPARKALGLVGLGAALAYGGAVAYVVREMRMYPPLPHEAIFNDPALDRLYGLNGRRTPSDFGFPRFDSLRFTSRPDGNRIGGWLVHPRDSSLKRFDEVVVFVHGHRSNRVKLLRFLPLLDQSGLSATHAAFLPDLRNSGTSERAPTDLGLQFADDLASSLEVLAERYGTRRVTIYAFSMGAMATAWLLAAPDLQARLNRAGIVVERAVLESPLANAPGVARRRLNAEGVPGFVAAGALAGLSAISGGDTGRLRLGPLLAETTVPVLIVQGTGDTVTPADLLDAEMGYMGANVRRVTLDGGAHVALLNDPRHEAAYTDAVTRFLQGDNAVGQPASTKPKP